MHACIMLRGFRRSESLTTRAVALFRAGNSSLHPPVGRGKLPHREKYSARSDTMSERAEAIRASVGASSLAEFRKVGSPFLSEVDGIPAAHGHEDTHTGNVDSALASRRDDCGHCSALRCLSCSEGALRFVTGC